MCWPPAAEEAGLLGTRAFIKSPPLPLGSIVAAFNFDMLALAPAGAPVGFIGRGRTSLDDVILGEIARSGRWHRRQAAGRKLRYPAGWLGAARTGRAHRCCCRAPSAAARCCAPSSTAGYHQPSDEAGQIELGGAIDDLLLHEALWCGFLADPMRYSGKSAVQP